MRRMRTRKGILALLFVAALVLFGVTTVTASAVTKNHPKIPTCSITSVAGVWGHNLDGWVNQGVLTPIAAAGKMTVASNGAVSGTETSTPLFGGGASTVFTTTGTLSVNIDCTGTLTLSLTDQSNALVATEVWAVVFVSKATALRGTLATLSNSSNVNVPDASATLNADKL